MKSRSVVAGRLVAVMVVGITLMFLVSVSYAILGQNKVSVGQETHTPVSASTMPAEVASVYEKDSDGDGLADWEEIFWGTDPDNPDTDGDGISDKDSVGKVGVAMEQGTTPLGSSASSIESGTEALSKDLFTSFMQSVQAGRTQLSPEEQEFMVQHAIQESVPYIQAPKFSADSLTSISATPESRQKYVQEVIRQLTLMIQNANRTNEFAALVVMMQGEKDVGIEELRKVTSQYTTHTETLKNIPVPLDAVSMHAGLIEATLQYIYVLEGFAEMDTDPFRAVASAQTFATARNNLHTALVGFREYASLHTDLLPESS